MPTFLTHLQLNRNIQSIALTFVCASVRASVHESIHCMGVQFLQFMGICDFLCYICSKVSICEEGLTWWLVINFYSSSACAVAFTTGNYVANCVCRHRESHTFGWNESLAILYDIALRHKTANWGESSFEL